MGPNLDFLSSGKLCRPIEEKSNIRVKMVAEQFLKSIYRPHRRQNSLSNKNKPDRERYACLDHRWASMRAARYFFSRLSSIGQQALPSQRIVTKDVEMKILILVFAIFAGLGQWG